MPYLSAGLSLASLLCSAALLAAAEKPGTLAGVVRYTGTVPPAEKILTTDGTVVEHADLVVDPKTRGLRDVVAVLEDAPAQPPAPRAEPVLVDQRAMVFVPRVLAVQAGRTVSFDNSDACNHSVMASSTVPANQFNLFVLPGKPYQHVFQPQKHPVQLGCSLHAWMRAWIYVVPHPWFAVSDGQGRFRLDNVPPGTYTLWLRHADTGLQERRRVEVPPGKTVEVALDWNRAAPR